MALTFVKAEDILVKFATRGAVDGTPTGTPTSVVVLCNSFMYREFVGKKIEGGGFTAKKFRPGLLEYEAELDLDISYTGGATSAPAGTYGQIAFTLPGQSEQTTAEMIIMSNDISAVRDDKGSQKIRLEGQADA
jgi:hypothetical protein